MARLAIEGNRGLPEADPREQSLHKAGAFRQPHQHVDDAAIEQAKIAGIVRDRNVRDAIENVIKVARGGALRQLSPSRRLRVA